MKEMASSNSSRQNRGLKSIDDFSGFSYNYYKFFKYFNISMGYSDTLKFYFEDASPIQLSDELRIKCPHSEVCCWFCRRHCSCDNGNYCPCPRCFETFSQKGVFPRVDSTRAETEMTVLELMNFVNSQLGWIVMFKTQSQIRRNPSKMRDECRTRINHFLDLLQKKRNLFFPWRMTSDIREEIFNRIRYTKQDLGF